VAVFNPFFAQTQMQPAPTRQHRAAVQAAAEHGAFVIDVGLQRQLQTQLLVMPVEHCQAHVPRQGNVVVEDRLQVTTVAAHARPLVC
jgi:hypothetical protein